MMKYVSEGGGLGKGMSSTEGMYGARTVYLRT